MARGAVVSCYCEICGQRYHVSGAWSGFHKCNQKPKDRFKVGDIVTRTLDGTDRHVVLRVDHDLVTVRCTVAPKSGWINVGEEENNLARRYCYPEEENDGFRYLVKIIDILLEYIHEEEYRASGCMDCLASTYLDRIKEVCMDPTLFD